MLETINIQKIISKITEPWKPIDVAKLNDQVIRIALFHGQYHWHKHEMEDELFLVYKGRIIIELPDGKEKTLLEGDCVVIPKGIEHKPKSEEKSFVLLFEPIVLKSRGD